MPKGVHFDVSSDRVVLRESNDVNPPEHPSTHNGILADHSR